MKLADLEKELGQTLPRSVDVALFGRMTTSAVFPDVPAALQVAHAISTGKVEKQYDYYTGVDDLVQEAEEVGAGMIGDVEFNSATYYKYFCLDWEQLLRNLAGKRDKKNLEGPERAEAEVVARQCLEAVLRAAALTTPTGKQNTFAAHNPPDAILVEVKKRRLPTSYANAFLRPRGPKGDMDVVDESILALAQYAPNLKKTYSIKPELSLLLSTRDHAFPDSERVGNLDQLAERLQAAVSLGAA